MATAAGRSLNLPLIPLESESVLLPGVTLRIPVSNRSDIPVLLTSLFKRTSASKSGQKTITVGCVPINSPLLSKDGQRLIGGEDADNERDEDRTEVNPAKASKEDLFGFGTLAKVTGVQGRGSPEPYLLVEGVQRFTVGKFTKVKPFFEAEVFLHDDLGMHSRVSL